MIGFRIGLLALGTFAFADAAFVATSAAQETDLGLLSAEEISFLVKHAPEINQTVNSGAVVAYGHIIEPPILVTALGPAVYVGGIQVFPQQTRGPEFLARKTLYKIQEQFLAERKRGAKDPLAGAKRRAQDLSEREGAEISFPKKKGVQGELQWVQVKRGGTESRHRIDACPWPLKSKHDFIHRALMRKYSLIKKAEGKPAAIQWLIARFDERQRDGAIASYKFYPVNKHDLYDELVAINLSCDYHPDSVGFRDPEDATPEHTKHRLSKEESAQKAADRITTDLRAGRLLIFSFHGERTAQLEPDQIQKLKGVQAGRNGRKEVAEVGGRLSLSPEEVESLLDELP